MNQLADIDFDAVPSDQTSSVIPTDLAAMMASLVVADAPFFTAAESEVLADASCSSVRGTYYEVVTIRGSDDILSAVPAARVLSRFGAALPDARYERHSKRHSSHVSLDLYGYVHSAGLAVVQVREGEWDHKRGFGRMSKTYYVVDTFGNSIVVPHGKLRGAARTRPFDLVRPLIAAMRDGGITVSVISAVPVRLPVRRAVV